MKFLKGAQVAPFFILSRPRGFSLVELMIVVAIIGILSSIAIPNFRKFQARSKTTEAKLQLAAIYTAETSFYSTYQIYHSCLVPMGYDPRDFRPQRFYTVGFMNASAIDSIAYTAATNLDLNPVPCPQNLPSTSDQSYFDAGSGVGGAIATSAHLPPTTVGSQADAATMTFVAGAGGIIFKDFSGPTDASAFTINEKKQIVTVRNGY